MRAVKPGEKLVFTHPRFVHQFQVGMQVAGQMVRAIDFEHNTIYLWESTWWRRNRHACTAWFFRACWGLRCMAADILGGDDEAAEDRAREREFREAVGRVPGTTVGKGRPRNSAA